MVRRDLATLAAHGVRAAAPETLPPGERSRPAAEPLYHAAVYEFDGIEASMRALACEGGYCYGRYGHPNARTLEQTVAALEGAEDAVATSSGMAAVACTVLALVRAGDRVLLQRDAYGGTAALLAQDLGRLGVLVERIDAYDVERVQAALAHDVPARALIVETMANPLVRETDLPRLAALCRPREVPLVVDNTFATPILVQPLTLGADVVIHSATKFLGGHHDVTCGVVCGRAPFIAEARGVVRRFGANASPMDAWLASRGICTLALRMERGEANAQSLAGRLARSSRVRVVHYPGRGAILSFDLGDGAAAARTIDALALIALAPSLGGVTTTVSHPATSSHRGLSAEERRELGIGDGLIRLSVGIEAEADLWQDLEQALG